MGTDGRGDGGPAGPQLVAADGVVELFGVDEARKRGGHAGDQRIGFLGCQLAAGQVGGASVLVLVGAVNEDDAGDLVSVGCGEELGDHAAVGVADDQVGVGHGGGLEQGGELVGHPGRVAGGGGVLAAAAEDVGFVVAAHACGGGDWLLDLGPVGAQTADEDDGGFAVADAAEEQLPTVDVEEAGVGARCREGFGGDVVERDRFDAVRWLGFDLEEQRCLLTGVGANDGDGCFGAGGEREPFEVDAAAFGDRLAEEVDHGLGRQDVAEELGADVLVDLVDRGRLPARCEVVEGPAQLIADWRRGNRCRGVGDRRARGFAAVAAVTVVAACRQCAGEGEGDEGCGQWAAPSGDGCGHELVSVHVTSRSVRRHVPAATRAPA